MIAGRLGGRRLRTPAGSRTRPTAERVREALFSMLGELDGARVLDLYAGSGALGIEALSRGATGAVFVERDPRAVAVLRENLRALAVPAETAEVRPGEALANMLAARARGEKYDLIFVDPPYAKARQLTPVLSDALPALLAHEGRAVIESDRRHPLSLELPLVRERRYGDTLITIHRQR